VCRAEDTSCLAPIFLDVYFSLHRLEDGGFQCTFLCSQYAVQEYRHTQKNRADSNVNIKCVPYPIWAQHTLAAAGAVQKEEAFCVLRLEVSRSVITVQCEFRVWFKKDEPQNKNVSLKKCTKLTLHCNRKSGHLKTEDTKSLLLLRRHLENWSRGPAVSMRSEMLVALQERRQFLLLIVMLRTCSLRNRFVSIFRNRTILLRMPCLFTVDDTLNICHLGAPSSRFVLPSHGHHWNVHATHNPAFCSLPPYHMLLQAIVISLKEICLAKHEMLCSADVL
jgi:hypothetical protein